MVMHFDVPRNTTHHSSLLTPEGSLSPDPTTMSGKRKSDAMEDSGPPRSPADADNSHASGKAHEHTPDCDEVRGTLRTLVDTREVKAGDLQKELAVSASAYQNS